MSEKTKSSNKNYGIVWWIDRINLAAEHYSWNKNQIIKMVYYTK